MELKRNRGSASLEASLVLPIFLMAMVMLYLAFQSVLAEAQVYEAAAETAEYMSEMAYTGVCNAGIAYLRFPKYVDEEDMVNKYVKNGIKGIQFLGTETDESANSVVLRVSYELKYLGSRSFTIKKRTYTGETWKDAEGTDTENTDPYVYVTDRQSVYHLTRQCTYLTLQIRAALMMYAEQNGYEPCAFCVADSAMSQVFITEESNHYHSSIHCSGLKRTVYRKKKSEVSGVGACSRCATGN